MNSNYGQFAKIEKKYKNLKKQNIQNTFIKTNLIKLVFIGT